MSKKAAVTEADMKRAFSAAVKSGLVVEECIMKTDEVRLIFTNTKKSEQNNDPRQPEQWD